MTIDWKRASATADAVLECMLTHYGLKSPADIEPWLMPAPSAHTFDLRNPAELSIAASELRSPIGRIRFHVAIDGLAPNVVHPMMSELRSCQETLALGEEVLHPLEQDDRDRPAHFRDVVSIRHVPHAGIALSSSHLPFHQDGLGTGGSVRFIAMCLDQAPLLGGDQSYVNVLAHGIRLANRNWRRFVEATQIDALTIRRVTGSQRIDVTGPVFYVDQAGLPAVHFRVTGGEYVAETNSAVSAWFGGFVDELTESASVESFNSGDCIVVDNLSVVHARTNFVEGDTSRRLSRKWFAISESRVSVRGEVSLRLSPDVYRGEAIRR